MSAADHELGRPGCHAPNALARIALAVVVTAAFATSCSTDPVLAPRARAVAASTTTVAPSTPPTCPDPPADATRSYAPIDPAAQPPPAKVAEIRSRGRLIVGVSADTLRFGARNPLNGRIEGFDIDILKEIANAIFGPGGDSKIEYRVITYAQRLPSLKSRTVDLVAHTMTINCVRWQQIAFSGTYFQSGQKVLVRKGSGIGSIDQLNERRARVCAPAGSTSLDNLAPYTKVRRVVTTDITDCLVRFQQGTTDAITSDDTVLAGFAAQDPYAEVVGDRFSSEPYGVGANAADTDLIGFVNGVLDKVRASGRWQTLWNTWLAALGPAPAPPTPVYGRTPAS